MDGRVWSYLKKGARGRDYGNSWLKSTLHPGGYYIIRFSGSRRMLLVHRLVAEAFLPRVKGKGKINHKNGIKTDNRVENLEWCTQQENIQHAFATGLATLEKPVRNLTSGEIFKSASSAARAQGATPHNLIQSIKHHWRCKGDYWKYE